MFARLVPAALVAAGFLAAPGCGPAKLNENRTLNLTGEYPVRWVELGPQGKPQTLTVDFDSTGEDVSVYVFREADAKGEDGPVAADPKKALGQQRGKTGSFTAEVPENTPTRVVVRGSGVKTDVNLKVTNKK